MTVDILSDSEAFLARIAHLLRLSDKTAEAKLLAAAKFRIEQTDYDNWDRGIEIYTIYLDVPATIYAEIKSEITNVQKSILEQAQLVLRTIPGKAISSVVIDPEIPYDPEWRKNVSTISVEQVLTEIDKQLKLMVAVATGGPSIKSVNEEYIKRQELIARSLTDHGLSHPNPYPDLWKWYSKWSSGDLPTYQSRRQYISDLYLPLIKRLKKGPLHSNQIFAEPTGWAKVDRGIGEIRKQLEQASNEEHFQTVGLLCRELLISLGQVVYDPKRHPTKDGVKPSITDGKRMIEAYIATELVGSANEVSRKHAKAALDLANDLQHRRTAKFRQAALCAEATTSVVNLIAIISGRRDP
jgi:hypothetical protein